MRLDIEQEDGRRQTIVSDGTWKLWLDGPIRSADNFLGESYDARKEQPGWDRPQFDNSQWSAATVDPAVQIGLSQMNEPIAPDQTFQPIALTEPKPHVYVFKLPQNIAGWCRLRLDGPAGSTIKVRHAEWLKPDGTLFVEALGGAGSTDEFVLDGKGPRTFKPQFTYHGFQYVEVTGLTKKPELDLLEGCVVGSDPPVSGQFECSDPLLNQIWHNAFWSQRGNMHSVPTDCPNRDERYGYGGDALSFAETAMYNMNMAAFFAKWTHDSRQAQTSHDKFPPYAPYPYFGANDTVNEDCMGWSDAGVQIPWKLYEVYGDRRVLEQHFDSVRRHIDRMVHDSKDGVWNVGTCGDC